MKQYEKEILQNKLDNEEYILAELEKVFKQASKDCADRIAALSARTDLENLQSIIYQKQYQQALKAEIDGILNLLQSNSFKTISEYLTACYQDGFISAVYSMHKQGIPLIMPINQEAVLQAIQLDSNLSTDLYTRLGEDVKELKKVVRSEVSRGVTQGLSYNEIALSIASNFKNTPFSKAKSKADNIAVTEGGRIANQAAMDSCYKAKEMGCDTVKQWCSTLDGDTRKSHRKCDGEIRELDEKFSNGLMFPCDPDGPAKEVCRCRCTLLERTKWVLDEEELEILKERAAYFGLDKSADFEDFKKKYLKAADSITNANMSAQSSIVWEAKGTKITNEQYKKIMRYAKDNNIALSGFKQFDGEIETVMTLIDDAQSVSSLYPAITEGKKKITIVLEQNMSPDDFAITRGHMISINANAYRNIKRLQNEYDKLVDEGWFVSGTDYHSIIKHEIGHVVSNHYKINCMDIAKEIVGESSTARTFEYLEKNLSKYSVAYESGTEIISECFASVYGSTERNEFALKFLEKCGNIISEKDLKG